MEDQTPNSTADLSERASLKCLCERSLKLTVDCMKIPITKTDFGSDGWNTVSESTVSNAELSEVFGPHRVLGRELSEFLSA